MVLFCRCHMLKLDISQIEAQGDTFFSSTDTAYLIFLVIGIVGYFSVPNVANYVVHAGGGNSILQKVNTIISSSTHTVAGTTATGVGMAADVFGDANRTSRQGYAGEGVGNYFPDKQSFNHSKLSGKD
ncbi:MAG: hypothetical protein EOP48_10615 [Sphingobacteriales bacterium]|nr:MAG: hypothetical protein EOP48_10615 [Sphingobacteriales bacterium]